MVARMLCCLQRLADIKHGSCSVVALWTVQLPKHTHILNHTACRRGWRGSSWGDCWAGAPLGASTWPSTRGNLLLSRYEGVSCVCSL